MRRETPVDGLSNDSEMFDNGKDDCSNWRKETPIEMSVMKCKEKVIILYYIGHFTLNLNNYILCQYINHSSIQYQSKD